MIPFWSWFCSTAAAISQNQAGLSRSHCLFPLGDFYETFDEDARLTSKELDIVLTSREMGKGHRVPLAGIPYHALDNYLARLVNSGHKVAICEKYHIVAPQLYAYLRRNGVQPNRNPRKNKKRVYRCVVCGTVRELPPYSPNSIWTNTPTCGDMACKPY
jgi:DNA mismatch repair ATPase MutS